MIKCDYHIHTNLCDGKNSPKEMVDAAVNMGLKTIGFSGHGYAGVEGVFGMTERNQQKYIETIQALRIKYADRIRILCGIEQEGLAGKPVEDFDYVIGSVHYVEKDGRLFEVDISPEGFEKAVAECFGGDYYDFCERYFESVANVVESTDADIIGHLDLVTKFNEGDCLFDTSHPRFVAAWQKAADKLLKTGKPFEINTGAISRGYRTAPYPSKDILLYILERGGKFILNSDSHSADSICFEFEKWEKWATDLGAEIVEKL